MFSGVPCRCATFYFNSIWLKFTPLGLFDAQLNDDKRLPVFLAGSL